MMDARSPLECHLYIDLNPCLCGGRVEQTDHRLTMINDRLCAKYAARCSACASEIEYLFALSDDIVPPECFGGSTPSTIIDAGQYMATSELAARQVSMPLTTEEARGRARYWLGRAVACIDEVMKWIPDGAEEVPEAAFFTPVGRQNRDREPGRFRRIRLAAVHRAYRQILIEL